MNRYRVIFLDIDGVLNSMEWYGKYYFRHRYRGDRITKSFDPAAVKRLNYIVAKTGAVVVVSSTWRMGKSVDDLRRILHSVGGDFLVTGKTARYVHEEVVIPRGVEIKEYYGEAFNYPSFFSKHPSKLKGYLILDDDGDMLYEQRNNFLKLDNRYGLTDTDVPKAIDILMRELPEVEKPYVPDT